MKHRQRRPKATKKGEKQGMKAHLCELCAFGATMMQQKVVHAHSKQPNLNVSVFALGADNTTEVERSANDTKKHNKAKEVDTHFT